MKTHIVAFNSCHFFFSLSLCEDGETFFNETLKQFWNIEQSALKTILCLLTSSATNATSRCSTNICLFPRKYWSRINEPMKLLSIIL